jgi:hypothetical protein
MLPSSLHHHDDITTTMIANIMTSIAVKCPDGYLKPSVDK